MSEYLELVLAFAVSQKKNLGPYDLKFSSWVIKQIFDFLPYVGPYTLGVVKDMNIKLLTTVGFVYAKIYGDSKDYWIYIKFNFL